MALRFVFMVSQQISAICRQADSNRIVRETVIFVQAQMNKFRPRGHKRGVDLFLAVPFDRLWHREPDAISNAIG